jgi:diaminopimelate decarboxylase
MDLSTLERALSLAKTPFYLFDTDEAAAHLASLRVSLGGAKLCYAMKANPFLTGALAGPADYLEVCSPGELRICRRAGAPLEKVVLSGVYKDPDELEAVFSQGLPVGTFTAESPAQWTLLAGLAKKYARTVHVLLRLTSGAQFGIEKPELCRMVEQAPDRPFVCVDGLQFFSGTQKKSETRMREELRRLDDLLEELHARFGFTAQRLEYGPGFPVDYFGADPGLERRMLDCLSLCLGALRFRGTVVLELGRELAAGCGSYATSVVDVKSCGGERFAIADGGIHQLRYDGQLMGMQSPPVLQLRGGGETENWTVFGALCTKNDVLLREHPFSGLHPGSVLVFQQAGAYSATEGMALFLSRELPQVLLYSAAGGFRTARARTQTDEWNFER